MTTAAIRSQRRVDGIMLRVAVFTVLTACLTPASHSFIAKTGMPSCLRSSAFHPSLSQHVDEIRKPEGTRVTSMEAGRGMGSPGRGMGGPPRGGRGGRGSGKGGKKAKGKSKQGSFVAGPPRLENVPESKLDEIFVFREEKPGKIPRVIECYADRLAVVGGRRYMIGHPCDWSVSICIPDGKDGVEPVPLESELMEELLPGLQRELETEDVHLFDTPVTLTLQGEFLDEGEEYDDDEEFDEEEEDEILEPIRSGRTMYEDQLVDFEVIEQGNGTFVGDDGHEEEVEERVASDIDEDGVELIASYWHEDKEYALVKHLDPMFIIARQRETGFHLLGPREAAVVKPRVEELMVRELEINGPSEQRTRDSRARKVNSGEGSPTDVITDEVQSEGENVINTLQETELAIDPSS